MLMKSMMGAIIGLMILVLLLLMVRAAFSGTSDRQQESFDTFHEKLVNIAKASAYTNDKFLLHMEEGYAIIGFGPVQGEDNGRYSNGEFFYNVNRQEDKKESKELAFTRSPMYLDREDAPACDDDQGCLCLCKNPSAIQVQDVDKAEIDKREIDKDGTPNPYDQEWITAWEEESSDGNRFDNRYNYNTRDRRLFQLQCKEISCAPIEEITFLSPAPCDCYFSEQKVEEQERKDCDYVFENGFAIYRREESISRGQSMAYEEKLPESVQVNLAKLPNGDVMVSLRQWCIETFENITR